MKTKLDYQPDITERSRIICEKYWLGASHEKRNPFTYSCREIADSFDITPNEVYRIAKNNAHLIVLECQCVNCDSARTCSNRTEFMNISLDDWECDICCLETLHRQQQDYRERAEQEIQLQFEMQQFHRKLLIEFRQSQINSIPSLNNINIIDHYLLVAVVNSLGTDNLCSTISLCNNLDIPLSPLYRLDATILDRLIKKSLLIVDIEDSYNCLSSGEEPELQLDIFNMTFDFAYNPEQLQKLIIDSDNEIFKNRLMSSSEYTEWCQEIQLGECISYLANRMIINDFTFDISEKMQSLLGICLSKYSVSEVYYMIWGAVESASSYSNKSGISKLQATNSIYGNIQRTYDKIDNNLISSKQFNRGSTQPQSAIAKMFFDKIYGVEDCGFRYSVEELPNQILSKRVQSTLYYPKLI